MFLKQMTKEEELDNEEMDSDFDETDHAPMNNGHNNHHLVIKMNKISLFRSIISKFDVTRKSKVWTKD
jgi:hypothetical protein